MSPVFRSICVLALLAFAAPAFSAEPMQIYRCELGEGATEEDAEVLAGHWLAEAKKLKGGKNFKVDVLFPVAVNATNQIDFLVVVTAPSFADWGMFWDNYVDSDSDSEDVPTGMEDKVVCPDSALWERISVKSE